MMKTTHLILLSCCLSVPLGVGAAPVDTLQVESASCVGPYELKMPYLIDSLNTQRKSMELKDLLQTNAPLMASRLKQASGKMSEGTALKENALYGFQFTVRTDRFVKADLIIEHMKNYKIFVDGYEHTGNTLKLQPREYVVSVVGLAQSADSFNIKLSCPSDAEVQLNATSKKPFSLVEQNGGLNYRGVSLSPSGKYLLTDYYETDPKGQSRFYSTLTETVSGKLLRRIEGGRQCWWLPRTDKLYRTEKRDGQRVLLVVDPQTGAETVMAPNIPEGWFTISPTEDYLIYSILDKNDEKATDLRIIYSPDDRQPGWRNRSQLYKYDLTTGVMQQLTYGAHTASLADISRDGKQLLMTVRSESWSKRPFYRTTLLRMDVPSQKVDTLLLNDGYMADVAFSPDGKQLLVKAWPDAFDGVGKTIAPDQSSSMYDYQLYVMNLADGKVKPMTRDFNPAVERMWWSAADGQVYFTADDADKLNLFTLNPKSGDIKRVDLKLDYVQSVNMASGATSIAWYGQTGTNSRLMYVASKPGAKAQPAGEIDFGKTLANVAVGKVSDFSFQTQRGDTITGYSILPYGYDPNKKFPLVVYYYGGCTPTSRLLEFFYPLQVLAGQGYGVLVLNPSGTIGFGQEFASRHVRAWGKRTADDIIEGVREFCRENAWIDSTKIGCMGASYGGFMTQYLLTQTDLFAAAISHAGISNIASYWGGGYWGYSYNEAAAMNSYPWNDPELYVGQSPLFMAEKIKAPLLLMHGTADTNVPTNESQQMFTALKILGKDVTYIQINGANHVVTEFNKREQCRATIFAWFARMLKGQPQWWDDLYGGKNY